MNMVSEILFKLENISKDFPIKGGLLKRTIGNVKALDDVSLQLGHGKTLGLVGESGCGKTTIARIILHLEKPTSGNIIYNGNKTNVYTKNQLKDYRKNVQMIFQDPYSSLNPQRNVNQILSEPFIIYKYNNIRTRISDILDLVNLPSSTLKKYPHELSGGLRQRLGIAKALTLNPKMIVCDEPVSALDVSIRSQIINLLIELQIKKNISYIFISHDLSLVEHISDNIAIMYLGQIVEYISSKNFKKNHLHPYTKALISSVPIIKPGIKKKRILLQGEIPSAINPPIGCKFSTRCPEVMDICISKQPNYNKINDDHFVSCHLIN